MNLRRLPVFVASLLCASACPAAEASDAPAAAAIAADERSTLETLACRAPHDVDLDRVELQVYGEGRSAPAVAEVHCKPQGVFMDQATHHVVRCARSAGKWDCQGEWNEIVVDLGDEHLPVRIEGEIPVGVSYLTVRRIADAGMFQGYPLREALVPPCYLSKGSAQEFIDVKCAGWHIVVSMWCPQSDCPRVFSLTKLGLP